MECYLFYNKKGGQGKTTLSTTFCKKIKGEFITNDENNYTEDIFKIPTKTINRYDDINNLEISDEKPSIFDFGGFSDDRVITIAKIAKVCIIPIFFQSEIDLKVALETFETIQEHNKNTIFVITNTEKKYIDDLYEFLTKKTKTFILRRSSYISNNSSSIYEQYQVSKGLERYTMKKTITDLDKLFKFLNQ